MGQHIEARGWMVTADRGYGPRTYRAYVPHLLSGWEPDLSEPDHEAVAEADRALSAIGSLPLSDMGSALARWMAARDESIRSSLIEGVGSTETGLAWARYMDATGRPVSDQNDALTLGAAKQVASAVALGAEMRAGRDCDLDDILDIHRSLFDGTRDRSLGGVLRDEPMWVGSAGCLVDEATFVAPPQDHVPRLMDDLVAYLNTSTHPPVIKAAVAHAQFETIHPFGDGNGRTGRAIIHTVLNAAGRAQGAVPISTTLNADIRSYYAALTAMQSVECDRDDTDARSAGLRPWLRLFSSACEDAARQAARSARRVEAIAARWLAAGRFRAGSAAAALVAELPTMPVLDAAMVAERLQVAPRAARRALASLEAADIVRSTGGRRNRRYQAPDLVGLLRQMAPDGGPPIHGWADQARTEVTAESLTQRTFQRCGHYGVRANLPCRLPSGHSGHHRYQPPR